MAFESGRVRALAFDTVYLSRTPIQVLSPRQQLALMVPESELNQEFMDGFISEDSYNRKVDELSTAADTFNRNIESLNVPAVQQATTDADGDFSFHGVSPGRYWLVLNDCVAGNYVGWSEPVTVWPGTTASASLNNTDTAYAFNLGTL